MSYNVDTGSSVLVVESYIFLFIKHCIETSKERDVPIGSVFLTEWLSELPAGHEM